MNAGYGDLIECRRTAKLNIETKDTPKHKMRERSAYIYIGDSEIVPVIYGTKTFKKAVGPSLLIYTWENRQNFKIKIFTRTK